MFAYANIFKASLIIASKAMSGARQGAPLGYVPVKYRLQWNVLNDLGRKFEKVDMANGQMWQMAK